MNVLTILNELAASAGQDAVRDACTKFLGGKAGKVKKERKPRGKSSWNLEVDKVLHEMRAVLLAAGESEESVKKKATYKMAFAEASRRRRENNPEAQAKYDASKEAKEAKAEPAAAPAQTIADVLDFGDTPPDTDEEDDGVMVDGVPSQYDAGTVYRFLFRLQESGVVNMLACGPELQRQFGMSEQEAFDIRAEYVDRYEELKAKYGEKPKAPARRASGNVLTLKTPKKVLPAGRSKIPIV